MSRARLQFIVIGGIAATLHGSRFVTDDVDVLVEATASNLEVLAGLLDQLDARDSRRRSVKAVLAALAEGGSARLKTNLGGFDVMTEIPAEGDFGFAALRARALRLRLGRQAVLVAALDDIIAMKEQAHRVKDLARLPELRRIQELNRQRHR
ncbi:MAG: hypothetical protein M3010_01085 [Candidatus Dormibacteraeota bacterium]|nr:hypothetical protein [Candidatus Dormibacteraeota bacterium]